MLDLSDFLWLHSVESVEVFSSISNQRAVARMIDRFDAGNGLHLAWFVLVDVLDQLGLGVGRAGDENGIGVGERFGDGVKILMISGSVSAPDRIGLVMDVLRRMLRMHDKTLDVRQAEMENAGFPVIDPDDGMIVRAGHDFSSFAGRCAEWAE
jgi:hypothetical protein